MSIQQLLKPANVENRSSTLYAYSQTVKILNVDVAGGPLDMSPSGVGILGQQLTSDGLGGVYWSAGLPPVVVADKIQSADLSSSITCINGASLISIGNLDMSQSILSNVGSITTPANTLNVITPTTQIAQGLSAWDLSIDSLPRITQNSIKSKLECGTSRLQLAALSDLLTDDTSTYLAAQNVALTQNMAVAIAPDQLYINQDYGAVNRLVVNDAQTGLYSKNAQSGPAGSLLELNNDNTFTLGCYFANNGIIECRPNSLALYGNTATSAITLTDLTIIKSLGVGGRIDREVLDTIRQTWYDPGGVERLRVSAGGVRISDAYTFPSVDGTLNQVLTTNGAGVVAWASPVIPIAASIQSPDALSVVQCSNAGSIVASTNGIQRVIANASGTTIQSQVASHRVLADELGGIQIDGLYRLPTTAGAIGQVLTNAGSGNSVWQSPQIIGLYSATSSITVANTIVQTSLIPSGVGSLTVPANYFTPGMSFQLSCGGFFRDNANNTQITFRLTNSGTLFSTGLLALSNVPLATTAWNISTQFTYVGGTTLTTNFVFTYNGGNDMFGFTSQQSNSVFNTLVPNTLDFTVQWAVANVNNTITCNYFTLTRMY